MFSSFEGVGRGERRGGKGNKGLVGPRRKRGAIVFKCSQLLSQKISGRRPAANCGAHGAHCGYGRLDVMCVLV